MTIIDAYEAKLDPDAFKSDHLTAFRQLYPQGKTMSCVPISTPLTLPGQEDSRSYSVEHRNERNDPACFMVQSATGSLDQIGRDSGMRKFRKSVVTSTVAERSVGQSLCSSSF